MNQRSRSIAIIGVAVALVLVAVLFIVMQQSEWGSAEEPSATTGGETGVSTHSSTSSGQDVPSEGRGPGGAADGNVGTEAAGSGAGREEQAGQGTEENPETGFALGTQEDPKEKQDEGEGGGKEKTKDIHCSVEGVVRRDGKPVSGVEVNLYPMHRAGEHLPYESGPTITDDNGAYSFPRRQRGGIKGGGWGRGECAGSAWEFP